MSMLNKLGHYIFKRICKDQERLRKKQAMNMYGMYVRPNDIQSYINDYLEYGYDYTGDDNIAADDKVESVHTQRVAHCRILVLDHAFFEDQQF